MAFLCFIKMFQNIEKMKKTGVLLCVCCLLVYSCSVVKQSKVLAKCSFAVTGLSDFYIAGINLDKVKDINQLNVLDAMKIVSAITNKTAEIKFKVGVDVKNPSNQQATINKIQWIVEYEGEELLRGSYSQTIVIQPNATTTVKVPVMYDAAKLLKERSLKDVYELYQNIMGNGQEKSHVILKVKPTIDNFTFPSFIRLTATL